MSIYARDLGRETSGEWELRPVLPRPDLQLFASGLASSTLACPLRNHEPHGDGPKPVRDSCTASATSRLSCERAVERILLPPPPLWVWRSPSRTCTTRPLSSRAIMMSPRFLSRSDVRFLSTMASSYYYWSSRLSAASRACTSGRC